MAEVLLEVSLPVLVAARPLPPSVNCTCMSAAPGDVLIPSTLPVQMHWAVHKGACSTRAEQRDWRHSLQRGGLKKNLRSASPHPKVYSRLKTDIPSEHSRHVQQANKEECATHVLHVYGQSLSSPLWGQSLGVKAVCRRLDAFSLTAWGVGF